MKFGENLKKLRKSKKISQEELAEKIGVSRQSVSKWECGEAYPEMSNILALCTLFRCRLNDIIHEKLEDLNLLDEEVKMNVVKLKKEKQQNVKGLSKVIYLIARIIKILMIVSIGVLGIALVTILVTISNVNIIDDNTIEIFDEKIYYEQRETDVVVLYKNEEIRITNSEAADIIYILENHSDLELIGFSAIAFIFLIATCILIYLVLRHLERLFMNIYIGQTPFTLENIEHLKKMAIYMIIVIIFPYIAGIFLQLMVRQELYFRFDLFNIVYILFLFSMVYIFEYGYEIQKDSKGIMYEEE